MKLYSEMVASVSVHNSLCSELTRKFVVGMQCYCRICLSNFNAEVNEYDFGHVATNASPLRLRAVNHCQPLL